jgi:hypothetical protein
MVQIQGSHGRMDKRKIAILNINTVENFHVKSLLLKQATVCPALKTRTLLIAINLQLINTFINFHKFTNLHFFKIIIFFKFIFSPFDSLNGFIHLEN